MLHFQQSPFTFFIISVFRRQKKIFIQNLLINIREKWIKRSGEEGKKFVKGNKRLHYASSDEPAEQFFIFHTFWLLSFNSREETDTKMMYTKCRFNFFGLLFFFWTQVMLWLRLFYDSQYNNAPPSRAIKAQMIYLFKFRTYKKVALFRVLWKIYVRIVSKRNLLAPYLFLCTSQRAIK